MPAAPKQSKPAFLRTKQLRGEQEEQPEGRRAELRRYHLFRLGS